MDVADSVKADLDDTHAILKDKNFLKEPLSVFYISLFSFFFITADKFPNLSLLL